MAFAWRIVSLQSFILRRAGPQPTSICHEDPGTLLTDIDIDHHKSRSLPHSGCLRGRQQADHRFQDRPGTLRLTQAQLTGRLARWPRPQAQATNLISILIWTRMLPAPVVSARPNGPAAPGRARHCPQAGPARGRAACAMPVAPPAPCNESDCQ